MQLQCQGWCWWLLWRCWQTHLTDQSFFFPFLGGKKGFWKLKSKQASFFLFFFASWVVDIDQELNPRCFVEFPNALSTQTTKRWKKHERKKITQLLVNKKGKGWHICQIQTPTAIRTVPKHAVHLQNTQSRVVAARRFTTTGSSGPIWHAAGGE